MKAMQEWTEQLPVMQQTVLISGIRGLDGAPKFHVIKPLLRWYRRCVLISAFDGVALTDPQAAGGGSFTGPLHPLMTLTKAANDFVAARDEMPLHFFTHSMHAFQILGYKHPDTFIRSFWHETYKKMVHALHLWPETMEQMDLRLGDNEAGWRARDN